MKKSPVMRWLCLFVALLFLAGCGQQAVVTEPAEETDYSVEEETDAWEETTTESVEQETEIQFEQWDAPDPYTAVENSGRKNTLQALHAELEENMKDKAFPDFLYDILREMVDHLYVSYEKWDGFFPDMPDKHAFIRVHLIDILPKIQEVKLLEEGSAEWEEAIEDYGSFTPAFSDGITVSLMGDRDWTEKENGHYTLFSLSTIMHEIQHIGQNDIMYSDYFDDNSDEWKLRYPFVEGGASLYSAFLDEPGTSPQGHEYMVSDNERRLEYRCSSDESRSYSYWTKFIEKTVWFLGFKTVGKVFAAQSFAGFKKELADRYGQELSEKWLRALEAVVHNYYPYRDEDNTDDVIINQIIHLERLSTTMLEQKIDALDNRQAVWDFVDSYRHYRTWFAPTLQSLSRYDTSDYMDGFIGLHRASKRLTAKIEEYGVLRFSDNPALNSEAIQALLYWRFPKSFKSVQYAFFQTESYGKLYIRIMYEGEDKYCADVEAYQFDASGNRRYYTDDYSLTNDSLLNSKERYEQAYYPLSHFSPENGKGTVYTQWESVKNLPVSTKAPTRRHITLGTFPQTLVKDKALIKQLNALPQSWTTLYLRKGEDGETEEDVKVRIADVTLDGKRYRAAQLSYDEEEYEYRLSEDRYPFKKGTIYWFAYAPLTWSVIDEEKGWVICDKVVDFEPFHAQTYESNDEDYNRRYYTDETKQHFRNQYAYASIRKWLNGAFFHVAFSAADQKKLQTVTISNEPHSPLYADYGTQPTKDRIFLPSVAELTDATHGFSDYPMTQDAGRTAAYTDYALFLSFGGFDLDYVLRTTGNMTYEYTTVDEKGCIHLSYCDDGFGVRPAACVDLKQF